MRRNETQNSMDFISVILTEMKFQTGMRFPCEHSSPETKWISADSLDVAFNAHVRLKLIAGMGFISVVLTEMKFHFKRSNIMWTLPEKKCLHMSIKISGRFEMQLKWNFMWTELVFTPVLKSQTGMSSFRLSPERTLSNILVILFFLQSSDQQCPLFNTCHLCFHSNLIYFNSCNVFEQQGAPIDGCFSLYA